MKAVNACNKTISETLLVIMLLLAWLVEVVVYSNTRYWVYRTLTLLYAC